MANVTSTDLYFRDVTKPLNIGLTVEALLQELETIFPERSAQYNETHAALMWKGGERSVVNWIRSRINEDQNE